VHDRHSSSAVITHSRKRPLHSNNNRGHNGLYQVDQSTARLEICKWSVTINVACDEQSCRCIWPSKCSRAGRKIYINPASMVSQYRVHRCGVEVVPWRDVVGRCVVVDGCCHFGSLEECSSLSAIFPETIERTTLRSSDIANNTNTSTCCLEQLCKLPILANNTAKRC
jgi:hypothetical protein